MARHWVQYHKTEEMGYECGEGGADQFRVLTNKGIADLDGSKVWIVAGNGAPRRYYLCGWFLVEDVRPTAGGKFSYEAVGRRGAYLRPMPEIGHRSWFRDFLRSQANFSLGFNAVQPRFICNLEALVA